MAALCVLVKAIGIGIGVTGLEGRAYSTYFY